MYGPIYEHEIIFQSNLFLSPCCCQQTIHSEIIMEAIYFSANNLFILQNFRTNYSFRKSSHHPHRNQNGCPLNSRISLTRKILNWKLSNYDLWLPEVLQSEWTPVEIIWIENVYNIYLLGKYKLLSATNSCKLRITNDVLKSSFVFMMSSRLFPVPHQSKKLNCFLENVGQYHRLHKHSKWILSSNPST